MFTRQQRIVVGSEMIFVCPAIISRTAAMVLPFCRVAARRSAQAHELWLGQAHAAFGARPHQQVPLVRKRRLQFRRVGMEHSANF